MGELGGLLAAQGLQTAAGVGNDISQAQALRGQQSYASSQNGFNAAWADRRAQDALQMGYVDANRARMQGEQIASNATVRAAKGGTDVASGPAAVARNDQQLFADFARLDAQNDAFRRSLGIQAQAMAIRQKDRMDRLAARGRINNQYIQAVAGAASGAMKGYEMYNRYQGLGGTPYASQQSGGDFSYTPPEIINPAKPTYDTGNSGTMNA